MTKSFNEGDASSYVDYLLPAYYGGKNENKKSLINSFENMLPTISDILVVSRNGIIMEVSYGKQFIFDALFRGDSCFVLGYFDKASNQIYFSQPTTRLVSSEILEQEIPDIEHEILNYIIPNYEELKHFKIGELLPPMELIDLDRKPHEILKKDTGLYFINMWSLNCKPCIEEIPDLNELKKKYQDSDIEFIAIAWHSDLEIIKNIFLAKHPFLFNQLVISNPEIIDLGVFPTHLIVDSNLIIIDKLLGASHSNVAQIEQSIQEHISK